MPINIFGNGSTVCLDVNSTELQPIKTANTGGVIVTDTQLLVNIPAGLEYLSHTASVGTFDDGTSIWTIPSLGVGSPIATLNICFTVTDDTLAPWVIEYSAVHDVDPDSIPEDQFAERNIDGLACSEFENCWAILQEFDSWEDAVDELGEGKLFVASLANIEGWSYGAVLRTPFV